jgi:hypothetical protein
LRAAWRGYSETVKVLLDAGADEHWRAMKEAEDGYNPEGISEVIKLLREDGLRKGKTLRLQ